MVSISTVTAENGKVSCETPEGTVVNININQRSALDCLLDTIQTYRTKKRSGTDAKPTSDPTPGPTPGPTPALRLGLGASMMSMGGVSLMLAIIFSVVRPQMILFYTGTHFWVGIPFIISGAVNIVACRRPNIFWEILAFIGLLLSFSVSIAGLVMAVNDYSYVSWSYNFGNVCDYLLNGKDEYYGYRATRPPRNYYNSDYNLSRCKEGLQKYQTMASALVVMTMLLMIWGICLSVVALGCRLKAFCSGCRCEQPAEEQDDPLISPNPPGEIFVA